MFILAYINNSMYIKYIYIYIYILFVNYASPILSNHQCLYKYLFPINTLTYQNSFSFIILVALSHNKSRSGFDDLSSVIISGNCT